MLTFTHIMTELAPEGLTREKEQVLALLKSFEQHEERLPVDERIHLAPVRESLGIRR